MSKRKQRESVSLDGTTLKWIALISMLIDHTAVALADTQSVLYAGMRLAGRLALPLYCFLLVEGFCHTRDVRRYLGRLGFWAVLSEIPYDLFKSGQLWYLQDQNVFVTLWLGLVALEGYLLLANRGRYPLGYLWCAAVALLAWVIRADYDWAGVGLICVLYWFRQKPLSRMLGGLALLIVGAGVSEISAIVSFLFMSCYNGERGDTRHTRFFYVFYPLHLAVLCLVRMPGRL